MDKVILTYLVASASNAADLLTSLYAFSHGFIETNAFMPLVRNSYIAALLGVLTFQALITAFLLIYLIRRAKYLAITVVVILMMYTAMKLVVSLYNAFLVLDHPAAIVLYNTVIKLVFAPSSVIQAYI